MMAHVRFSLHFCCAYKQSAAPQGVVKIQITIGRAVKETKYDMTLLARDRPKAKAALETATTCIADIIILIIIKRFQVLVPLCSRRDNKTNGTTCIGNYKT